MKKIRRYEIWRGIRECIGINQKKNTQEVIKKTDWSYTLRFLLQRAVETAGEIGVGQ